MERLTKHWGDNYVPVKLDYIELFDMSDEQAEALQAIVKKLAEYEDIGTVEEFKVLKDKPKCDECAGCTAWKCDYSNVQNKAIDDFVELALKKFTEFDVKHGYPTVTDCKVILRDIAEQMKQ